MRAALKKMIELHDEVSQAILRRSAIDAYLDKIMQLATIIPYYEDSSLNGFIAFYANDISKKDAFLTILIVDPACKGKGLGKLLLAFSIKTLKSKGFRNYKLEVSKENKSAVALYKAAGFAVESETEDSYLMNLSLSSDGK